jgi:hypothetical protein
LNRELFVGIPALHDYIKSSGAIIFVHKPSQMPIFEVEGISVSTGFETYIVVDKIITNKLDAPYSDCIMESKSMNSFKSSLYRLVVNNTGNYHQTYCLQYCYQFQIIHKCNCTDELSPGYELKEVCKNFEQLECMYSALRHLTENSTTSKCFEQCNLINFVNILVKKILCV